MANAISIVILAQDQASQTFKAVTSNLQGMKQGADSAASGFAGMAAKLAALAAAAVSVDLVATKIKDLGVAVVETAGKFERMRVQLDTLTGGQGGAKLEELNAWAKKMPVDTEVAVQAFIRLKAMGLDPTLAQMTTLVDTTAALGGSTDVFNGIATALGQIATKGKVSAEELMQLAERGIPAYEILRQKLNLTAADVANIGAKGISSKTALAALFEGLSERFGGQSERMLTTWDGMVEALKSEWTDFKRLIADQGLFDAAKAQAQELLKAIHQASETGELKKLAADIAAALIAIGQLAAGFVKVTAAAAQFSREHKEMLAAALVIGGAVKIYAALEAGVLAISAAQKTAATAAAALAATETAAATAAAATATAAATAAASTAATATSATAAGVAAGTAATQAAVGAAAAATAASTGAASAAMALAASEALAAAAAGTAASAGAASAGAATATQAALTASVSATAAGAKLAALGTEVSALSAGWAKMKAALMSPINPVIGIAAIAAAAYEVYQLTAAIGKLSVYEADAAAQTQRANKARADEVVWLAKANAAMGTAYVTLADLNKALTSGAVTTDQYAKACEALGVKSVAQAKAQREAKQEADALSQSLANLETITKSFKDVDFSRDIVKQAKEARAALDLLRTDPFASQRDRTEGIKAFLDKLAELKLKAPEVAKELDKLIPSGLAAKANEAAAALGKIGVKSTADLAKSMKELLDWMAEAKKSGKATGQELADAYEQAIKKIMELAKTRPEALKGIEIPAQLKDTNLDEFLEKIRQKTKDFSTPIKTEIDEAALEKEKQKIRDGDAVAFRAKINGEDLKKEQDKVTKDPIPQPVKPQVDEAAKAQADAALDRFRQPTTHKVNPDTADAQAAIAELKKPTSSTHTVYVKKVEENAVGGEVGRYAAGGGVAFRRLSSPYISQGGGAEDDVPAMLMRGEFVMKQAAVRKYGAGMLYALNEGRVPLEMVPRFAAGGLVLPQAYVEVLPRFAAGGLVNLASWLKSLTTYTEIPAVDFDPAALVAKVSANLKYDQMSGDSQSYLSGVMRTFSGVYPQVFDTSKKATVASSLSSASASIQARKALIEEEYNEKIALLRQTGNDELAAVWEEELLVVQQVIDSLLVALQTLQEDYADDLATIKEDTETELADIRTEAETTINGLTATYNSEYAEKQKEYNSKYNMYNSLPSIYVGNGTIISKSGSGRWARYTTLSNSVQALYEEMEGLGAELKTLTSEYNQEVQEAKDEAESEAKGTKKEYKQNRREADTQVKQDIRSESNDAAKEGQSQKLSSEKELKSTFNEYLSQIQELQIEMKTAIQELVAESSSMSVSGFSHWLSNGGLVGYAAGGAVTGGEPGRDSVPALLMPGEVVLRKRAVDSLGTDYALWLNSLGEGASANFSRVLHFSEGGAVPGAVPGAVKSAITGGPGENLGTINFQVGGESFAGKMKSATARALQKELLRMQRGVVA